MVERQVSTQVKVRDFGNTAVTISPADYTSWHDARTELMAEAKSGLKARVEAELAAAVDDTDMQNLRHKFAAEERSIEHDIGAPLYSQNTPVHIH